MPTPDTRLDDEQPRESDDAAPPALLHLHRGGTSVVVDLEVHGGPAIVHWGEELSDSTPDSLAGLTLAARPQRWSGTLEAPPRLTVVARGAAGWLGPPALEGHRAGAGFSALFEL